MRRQFEHEGRLISYRDVQPPAERQAGVLVLLHAFPLAAAMWEPQLAAVPTGWRFVAPDLRGFGASSPDPPDGRGGEPGGHAALSIDDYARDVLALLDHLSVAAAVVCGLSMGGYVAFGMLRLAAARVRGLVLADTRPDADTPAGRAARGQALETLRSTGVAGLADGMVPRLLGASSRRTRPDLVAQVRQLAAAQAPDGVAPAIGRLMTRPDATAELAAFARPLLVVCGEEDEITPPDVARQMHGLVADAALALIGHAGHLSNLEQPAAFNTALDRFLTTRFIQP